MQIATIPDEYAHMQSGTTWHAHQLAKQQRSEFWYANESVSYKPSDFWHAHQSANQEAIWVLTCTSIGQYRIRMMVVWFFFISAQLRRKVHTDFISEVLPVFLPGVNDFSPPDRRTTEESHVRQTNNARHVSDPGVWVVLEPLITTYRKRQNCLLCSLKGKCSLNCKSSGGV